MFTPNTHLPRRAHLLTYLLLVVTALAALLVLPLKAQECPQAADPINAEFSGPLAVVPEMVMVGDPGNSADPLTGLGAVQEPFEIGKYDVTVLQWATFLNAVHVIEGNLQDPRHLYHDEMFREENPTSFLKRISGIIKNPVPQPYDLKVYEEKVTLFFPKEWGTPLGHYFASLPMTGLSIDDCKRYINWLHHGSPNITELNEETLAITETGAYDFTQGKQGELMEGARYFLPTLNQWYKAAYYQGGSSDGHYWRYPTQGNLLPHQTPSFALNYQTGTKTGVNVSEISTAWPHLKISYKEKIKGQSLTTPVGAFQDSPSAYGTYDMGGNVRQWTSDSEAISTLIAPGGSYDETSDQLLSTKVKKSFSSSVGHHTVGLRICALPTIPLNNNQNSLTEPPANSSTEVVTDKENNHSLFAENLANITTAQLTAYGLESILSIGVNLMNQGELLSLAEIIRPFTLQRNIVNTILSVFLAATTTGEASCMNIKKIDYWNIGLIVLSTVATMCGTETLAFGVEAAIGKVLEYLSEKGIINLTVQDSVANLAWPRLVTNGWYIGLTTYSTTKSDLKFFNEQQRKLKEKTSTN